MHAMILDEQLNFKWAEVPDPVRKPDEVLIRVHAAAVNRADLMQKDGCYSSPGTSAHLKLSCSSRTGRQGLCAARRRRIFRTSDGPCGHGHSDSGRTFDD